MNFIHLKYVSEVARTKSVTKAAENLFMSQPNLSRGIRELEDTLGYKIFKRTSKGLIQTREGEEFLLRAKKILQEVEVIESIGKKDFSNRHVFSISVPRASYISRAFSNLVANLDLEKEIEFDFKETNEMRTIDNVLKRNYNMGILRYQSCFEELFTSLYKEKGLKSKLLYEFEYKIILSKNNPLSNKKTINLKELVPYIELVYGDPYVPTFSYAQAKQHEFFNENNKRVLVYDRGSVFDLLSSVSNSYMFSSFVPKNALEQFNLKAISIEDNNRNYKDVLIYKNNYKLSKIDKKFLSELARVVEEN